jgi:hypothetical protein
MHSALFAVLLIPRSNCKSVTALAGISSSTLIRIAKLGVHAHPEAAERLRVRCCPGLGRPTDATPPATWPGLASAAPKLIKIQAFCTQADRGHCYKTRPLTYKCCGCFNFALTVQQTTVTTSQAHHLDRRGICSVQPQVL